jgi:Flp pilus assembly pilin Flp
MRLLRRNDGQSLVEYVLIIGLVSIVLILALTQLAGGITNLPLAAVIAVL